MTSAFDSQPLTFSSRVRDRRLGLGDVLMAVSRGAAGGSHGDDGLPPRTAFEEMLRRVLGVRSVHLRDGDASVGDQRGPESIALEIPHASPPSFLEATFDPGAPLGEWDFQLLGFASHLAALVLDLESKAESVRTESLFGRRGRRDGAAPLIGSTDVMRALRARIERVAQTDFTVLLEGESGVGKELVARQIHELSTRNNGPFVAINCAALVETLLEAELFGIEERTATGVRGRRGKFEHADGGTLFLDEVSDLSLSAQAKLLRAIQDLAVERVGSVGIHRIDTRIVAATNRPLTDLVPRGLFRPDLFYRLSGVDVRVPPLRERRPDVVELSRYFLERHRAIRRLRFSTGALNALSAYDWPGNVRELERTVEHTVALAESPVIELDDLPSHIRGDFGALNVSLSRNDTMRAWGSRYARLVLARSDGNKREAARLLGITYHTLNSYLRFQLPEDSVEERSRNGHQATGDRPEQPAQVS
jgi:two-component system response regulator HydG